MKTKNKQTAVPPKGKKRNYKRLLMLLIALVGVGFLIWIGIILFGNNYKSNAMRMKVNSVVATTTFDQAESIMNDLLDAGVKDLNLRYTGWCNGGVQQRVLTSIHVEGGLGGENGMKKLMKNAAEKGVDLYFDGISCFAYDSGFFNGFNSLADAARATTRTVIKLYSYDIVTYRLSTWMDNPYFLVKPSYAKKCLNNLI